MPRMKTETQWLRTREMSELTGLHPETIRDMCRRGELKCKKFGARSWRIHYSEVLP